jgi:nicotinate-nucleotide adenylyltransferase
VGSRCRGNDRRFEWRSCSGRQRSHCLSLTSPRLPHVSPIPQSSSSGAPYALSDSPLALFGGTFDPVHFGHLRVAQDAATTLKLPEVRLIPAQQNVLRDRPGASAADRLEMLRLAVHESREFPGLAVDDCEIARTTPSYTITTLEAFRKTYPTRPLVWLIGVDAFLRIQSWHRAHELFDFAHFVVLNRPGFATANVFSAALSDIWNGRIAQDASVLRNELFGRIYLHTVAPQTVSATEIRNKIRNRAADNELQALLPSAVLSYIRAHQLYLD